MHPLFLRIDNLNLLVSNLDEALVFYCQRLGHSLIWRTDRAAGLRLPDSDAELVLHTDNYSTETDLMVESVSKAIAEFVSAGGKLVSGPHEIAIGHCAVVEDPWCNRLVILDCSKGKLQVDNNMNVVR
jgi:catechol 2,3-dioxygenase-like lactoylglutathione lyase family enzyme